MNILDGKKLKEKVTEEVKKEVLELKGKGIIPGLAVIIVGGDPASRQYVDLKKKNCEEVGFYSEEHALPEDISQQELLAVIDKLNKSPKIHGVLLQHPIPAHLDEREAFNAILPDKDVDGFHPVNVGKLCLGEDSLVACTPAGIMEILKEYNIKIAGQECVVVGRSNIVGKPMSQLLLKESGTVTVCHSKTKNLADVCKRADILIAAVGRAKLITADMVKPGAVVIDVGTNKDLDTNKTVGDVDFEGVKDIVGFISPVPGGVGPMTRAMLLKNTLKAAKSQCKV